MSVTNRYVVTLSAYVWADNEQDARAQGERYAQELNHTHDCRATVDAVCRNEWGQIGE